MRAVCNLPPCAMPVERFRLLPKKEYKEGVKTSRYPDLRSSVGHYDFHQHACFMAYDFPKMREQTNEARREQWMGAKILTHEMVHFASTGGLHDFSRTLNEGMTETIARDIFRDDVRGHFPHVEEDPNEVYAMETCLWTTMKSMRPELEPGVMADYWQEDCESACERIEEHVGAEFRRVLAGQQRPTFVQYQAMNNMLLKKDHPDINVITKRIQTANCQLLVEEALATMRPPRVAS